MEYRIRDLEGYSDKRLGRHVRHDPRSRFYRAPESDPSTLVSVAHTRRIPVLDQGNLGSCTGNACVGALGTDPIYPTVPANVTLDEHEAVALYSAATLVDPYPGSYPPDDTGSDGLSAATAARNLGLASGFTHAFTLNALLTGLQTGPAMIGSVWLTGMDTPTSSGMIRATGSVRGGHEYVADEIDVDRQVIGITNSWGDSYGLRGRAYLSWSDMALLLEQDGDATFLVPLSKPAPVPVPPADDDQALWEELRSWAGARHVGGNRLAALAVQAWAKKKGYR
jgi:hypothetical protein